jgi:hypothetical protein
MNVLPFLTHSKQRKTLHLMFWLRNMICSRLIEIKECNSGLCDIHVFQSERNWNLQECRPNDSFSQCWEKWVHFVRWPEKTGWLFNAAQRRRFTGLSGLENSRNTDIGRGCLVRKGRIAGRSRRVISRNEIDLKRWCESADEYEQWNLDTIPWQEWDSRFKACDKSPTTNEETGWLAEREKALVND